MPQMPGETSVLIVGGGPCGLTLAIELGRRGISTVLVDAKPGTALNPQANATQARTMEHFRRLGFANEIRSLGLPPDHPTDIAYFTRYGARELARFRLPSSKQACAIVPNLIGSWSAAELPHRVSQKYVEQVLRRHASALDTVSVHYGWSFNRFAATPQGVDVWVDDLESGQQRILRTAYLIGADGSRSAVRRQLRIRYAGETGVVRDFFGGKMVSLYLRAPDFYKKLPLEKAWMYWAFNRERRSWLASVNGRDEFAFHTQLKPSEGEHPVTAERARQLFLQTLAVPLEIEVLAVDTWTAGHSLVTENFGSERVYIAGDAAHLFTPAGGLGYNTAVEDAVNIGWKLASSIRGAAGPTLLQSYAIERRKMAIRNTEHARNLAMSIGNFVPDPALEQNGPEGEAARAIASAYLNAHARREFNIPGITFGGRYDGSPVIIPDGTAAPPDAPNTYVPTARPGGRPPHAWLDDGRSLYDLFGFDWTLLDLGTSPAATVPFEHEAQRAGIDLKIVHLASPIIRGLYEADLALIRPDQIVAWRGNAESCARIDCRHLLERVLGRASQASCARKQDQTE